MIYPMLRRAAVLCIAAGALAAGCSSSSPSAQAYANVVISAGPNGGGQCPYPTNTTVLQVGTGSLASPSGVGNGAEGDTVVCTVHPDGQDFDIQLNVATSGLNAASLYVTGKVTSEGAMTSLTASLSLSANNVSLGSYGETECSFGPYATSGNNQTAPTRIWGHLSCSSASNSVGGGTSACDIEADLQFQFCGG